MRLFIRALRVRLTRCGPDRTLPNHLLISAAPDLLEACKALTEALRWHFIPLVERYASAQSAHGKDDVIEQALAAIAKAEGR